MRFDQQLRLEPDPRRHSLAAGFAAAVYDPAWFLARQWMMGEFQGENASSPVRVDYGTITTAVNPADEAPTKKPTEVPTEAIVEDEPDSWWTMGRRIRIGAAVAGKVDGADLTKYLFVDPAPPYEQFAGAPDGLALWRGRPAGLAAADFDPFGVPAVSESFWASEELVYEAAFPLDGQDTTLELPRHRGGRVDWFSADASAQAEISGEAKQSYAFPAAMQYPGAPVSRWWEIEDATVDIGGYPPDSSHFATTLLIELICSHSDDWFLFPIDVPVGNVSTVTKTTITDSFGRTFDVEAPEDWYLFRTRRLDTSSLVLWLRAVTPVEGPTMEDVLFGLDEYSNKLWAVETRIDNRDVTPRTRSAAEELDNPATASPPERVDSANRTYTYVPGTGATPFWHPYEIEDVGNGDGIHRRFIQRRIADLSRAKPELLPAPAAEVLRVRTPIGGEVIHQIEPATIPSIGIHIQRRYKLARDVNGNPCLWIERQRTPVLRAPGQQMRFDVMAEVSAPS